MLAANALRAIVEPMPTVTNSTGATRMPASPPSAVAYMNVIMIIVMTGMPSRLAISLSWEVACIFLPSSVRSKNTYCSVTIATVTTRMTMYWVSRNTSPMEKPGTSNMLSSVCGRGP
jgi:hypothetical protein